MTNAAYGFIQSATRSIKKLTYILCVRTLIGTVCFALKHFFPYSVLNDNEFKQGVIGKQGLSNTENFIKGINSKKTTSLNNLQSNI